MTRKTRSFVENVYLGPRGSKVQILCYCTRVDFSGICTLLDNVLLSRPASVHTSVFSSPYSEKTCWSLLCLKKKKKILLFILFVKAAVA